MYYVPAVSYQVPFPVYLLMKRGCAIIAGNIEGIGFTRPKRKNMNRNFCLC
jgi:hypothetical protein